MAKGRRGSLVGQLPGCEAAGVSVLQSRDTNSLSHCCRVAWNCQFPIFCSGCVVGSLWRDAACRCGCEFPCDRGGLVRRRSIEWICPTAKRGVDAPPANNGSARESAGDVARTEGGAGQRLASRARSEWQLFSANRGESDEGESWPG